MTTSDFERQTKALKRYAITSVLEVAATRQGLKPPGEMIAALADTLSLRINNDESVTLIRLDGTPIEMADLFDSRQMPPEARPTPVLTAADEASPSTWSDDRMKTYIQRNGHDAYRQLVYEESRAKGHQRRA